MRSKWGQNFLVHEPTARRIVQALGPGPADRVLEIGPGRGALTEHLLETAVLTVVELDRVLAESLERRWGGRPGFTVAAADFLRWPLPESGGAPWAVIGNLPYSAAGAILRKVIDWPGWDRAVFMVQKEVAERMVAGPGSRDYGILSLAVAVKARAWKLFHVSPGAFRPAPKVTSTVVALERRAAPLVEDEPGFFRAVHAAFAQRRKTVLNNLAHSLEMAKEDAAGILREAGIDPGRRAETLSWEDFDRLSRRI